LPLAQATTFPLSAAAAVKEMVIMAIIQGENVNENRQVLVFGATGNMGGAVARELLHRGWQVRGVTRNLQSKKALVLAKLGVEMVPANMTDRASVEAAFAGMTRVFSVQNWITSGVEGYNQFKNIVLNMV
jgi:NAD(P)-dependent dehydrogenase (short-subunit alcohol dehydrogenase family)